MKGLCRFVAVCGMVIVIKASWGFPSWTKPTAEELSMTSQPEVPGAPAVYLYRKEFTQDLSQAGSDSDPDSQQQDFCSAQEPISPLTVTQEEMEQKTNYHQLYVRLKVLTADGVRYGNISIEEPDVYFASVHVEGRTVQPDGSEVAFKGVVRKRLLFKWRDGVRYRISFDMPDVRPGSIIEYRVTVNYPWQPPSHQGALDNRVMMNYAGYEEPPRWFVQQDLFVRAADYQYLPNTWIRRREEAQYDYVSKLPEGAAVTYRQSDRSYGLHVKNVMPLSTVDYMGPLHNAGYRVVFHKSCWRSNNQFWAVRGKWWSDDADKFADAGGMKDIAGSLVAAGDSDEQKVVKLYAAVQQLENLSYAKDDALAQAEATELKITSARDVWARKQGSSEDLTLLFVGLARAAGLKAYAVGITNRDQDIFVADEVREDALDDYLAIVNYGGAEHLFDPGQPFCPPGLLAWKHTYAGGLRQSDSGPVPLTTPGTSYKQAQMLREAKLSVAADGNVNGTVKLTLIGGPAMEWRQRALMRPNGVGQELEQEVGSELPAGFVVKGAKFDGLTDRNTPLTAQLELIGKVDAGLSVPEDLFEAKTPARFAGTTRDMPIILPYPQKVEDKVLVTLAPGMKVKSAPADTSVSLGQTGQLTVKHETKGDSYQTTHILILGKAVYPADSYAEVKDFYGKVRAADEGSVVLEKN